MKYVLILYMCSFINGECPSSQISSYEFNNHVDCVSKGYEVAYSTFISLQELENFERERIEREKIVIKFECKKLGENT